MMAEKMFHLPIFYLEYSGTYGDPTLLKKRRKSLENTVFFMAEELESANKQKKWQSYADVIVVGNIIYEDLEAALKTVTAVK